jgi:hypothetical protein
MEEPGRGWPSRYSPLEAGETGALGQKQSDAQKAPCALILSQPEPEPGFPIFETIEQRLALKKKM